MGGISLRSNKGASIPLLKSLDGQSKMVWTPGDFEHCIKSGGLLCAYLVREQMTEKQILGWQALPRSVDGR